MCKQHSQSSAETTSEPVINLGPEVTKAWKVRTRLTSDAEPTSSCQRLCCWRKPLTQREPSTCQRPSRWRPRPQRCLGLHTVCKAHFVLPVASMGDRSVFQGVYLRLVSGYPWPQHLPENWDNKCISSLREFGEGHGYRSYFTEVDKAFNKFER